MNRDSFLVLDRHFAVLLEMKMYLTSPAVAVWRTNLHHNYKNYSLVWSTVVFLTVEPLIGRSVLFAKFSK